MTFYNNKENAIEDLEKTVKLLKNIKNYEIKKIKNEEYENTLFSKISPVYPFTNEMMKQYNEHLDLKNKKVLTVTSSSDQAIISMMKGAKKIDTFDCNKLSYYHMFFKLSAIKSLSYENFIKLYTINNKTNITQIQEIYENLRKGIDKEDVRIFWDLLIKKYPYLYKYLFMDGICSPDLYEVDFLEKEKYYKTKEKINLNVTFNLIKVYKLYKLEEKYDFINLSNIMNYDLNKISYSYLVKHLIDNNLEKNGTILATYEWKDIDSSLEYSALKQANCNPQILKLEKKEKYYENTNSAIFCSK